MKVATGLAIGSAADPSLAAQAVAQAMQALDVSSVNSVLLFLTTEFASDPQSAIYAAAKAASTMQVIGCSSPGIFTEQDWVLDAPAAAAMVFSGDVSLQAALHYKPPQMLLSLTAPNAINTNWLSTPGIRFGGVSGDAIGQGPFSVWQNSKGMATGYAECVFGGVKMAVAATHGLRILTKPQLVTQVNGYELQKLADKPSLTLLQEACGCSAALRLHLLMAIFADSAETLERGDYQLATLVSGNEGDNSVTLAKRLEAGQYLSWAIRDVEMAQTDLLQTTHKLSQTLQTKPDFGLLFSCMGRGPYFYGGLDKDLLLLKEQFPDMPLIGFYGNGEIAPINGVNELLQYSAVLGLFACDSETKLGN